jgi:excisionase family DNA binding protein
MTAVEFPSKGGLISAEECAAYLGVEMNWVYRNAKSGLIPSVKIGKYRKFRISEIDAWLDKQRKAA